MKKKIYLPNKQDIETLGNQISPIVADEFDAIYETIESKGGIVPEEKNLTNLPDAINSIHDRMDELIVELPETITTDATAIRPYAFYAMANLRRVIAPNAISIGTRAFEGCSQLKTWVDMPNCTGIAEYAFANTGFEHLNDDTFKTNIKILPNGCFQNCKSLVDIDLPGITKIGNACFYSDSILESISLPDCEEFGTESIYYHPKLTSLYLPKLKTSQRYVIENCPMLEHIEFPSLTNVTGDPILHSSMSSNVSQWKTIRFGSVLNTGNYTLIAGYCEKLTDIYFDQMECEVIMNRTKYFNNIPKTCVFHCINGTIENINDAWTIVHA